MLKARNVLLRFWVVSALSAMAFAGSAQNAPRVVDENVRVTIAESVHPMARAEFRIAPASRALPMDRMVLVLPVRKGAEEQLDALLEAQLNPKSSQYHKWLTPEQFGKRFGITDSDLATVKSWLTSQGFRIDEVVPGRGSINFSGSVDQVENAFQTRIDDYLVEGVVHHANSLPASIPAALSGVVTGVLSLHDFHSKPMIASVKKLGKTITPDYTSGGSHYLAPGDWQKIYNVTPLYSSISGSGQTIAISGRTDIKTADVTGFRSTFKLPAKSPSIVHNGADPGNLGGGEEIEADLDVEWSGAIAKNATIKFVISKSTASTDGVDLSAQYIVSHNLAPVMSTSFGQCEKNLGTAGNAFFNNLYKQAASQGITAFVSSGDSGAAGCNAASSTKGSGRGINGLGSTPYNVAVGGTQFSDTSNPSTYWSSTNSSTFTSAKGYIPEKIWNESGHVSGGSDLWSGGGGVSIVYSKPAFQKCKGVPADGKRDVPDVAATAAGHDGYLVASEGSIYIVSGTSASSPSWASVMALVVQKKKARQGNANTRFYALGSSEYSSGGTAVFHDTKSGNNTVPGVTGFSATTAYDLASGLGSPNVDLLVTHF